MENSDVAPDKDQDDVDSLESTNTVVEPSPGASGQPVSAAPGTLGSIPAPQPAKAPRQARSIRALLKHINIYLLAFGLLIVVAIAVFVIAMLHSTSKPSSSITSQNLSQSVLSQLATSDVTVGDAKQVLNVQSNAVFAGQVLVRSDLQVAGKLQVGGSLTLSGVTVSGTSAFDQVQVNKNLAVAGDTALQGQLTVQKSLNVNGGGTFSGALSAGQVTVTTLQLNGDLILTHHITAGGVTPTRANGNNLGGGGTTSVSGSDSAGSITINTGGGASAGCFITVTFASKYNATPHVIVTPVGSSAAGLQYYVNRSTSNFSICAANAPGSGQTFGFDYLVVD